MQALLARFGGFARFGEPADFFSGDRAQKYLRAASLWGLFALGFAPFVSTKHVIPLFIPSWQSEYEAAVAGLLVWFALGSSRAWRTLNIPAALMGPVLIGIVALVQGALGLASSRGVVTVWVAEMAWSALLMLAVSKMQARDVAMWLGSGLVASGLANAALGIIQAMRFAQFAGRPEFYAADGLAYGFLAQRNLYADALWLSSISLVVPTLRARWQEFARWCLIITFYGASSCAGSKAQWLYAIAFCATGLLVVRADRSLAARLLSAASAFAVIFELTLALRAHLSGVIHSAQTDVLRALWTAAWRSIQSHPLAGIGLGKAGLAVYAYAQSAPTSLVALHTQGFNHVHDLVLQLWVEAGVVGLIALIPALWVFLRFALQAARAAAHSLDAAKIWAFLMVAILGLHSLVEFPLWTLPFLGIASIAIAQLGPTREFNLPRSLSVLPIAIYGLAGLIIANVWMANREVYVLDSLINRPAKPSNVLAMWQTSATLSRYDDQKTPAAEILRPLVTLARTRYPILAIQRTEYPIQLQHFRALWSLAPVSDVGMMYSALLALNGRASQAAQHVRLLKIVYPAQTQDYADAIATQARWLKPLREISKQLGTAHVASK